METYDVAHVREQGVDLIIVFVASTFGSRSNAGQAAATAQLQRCARAAGLGGTVVPVWQSGGGWQFRAPRGFHPFFQSVDISQLAASVNTKLTCG